jgi:hypothetical protein
MTYVTVTIPSFPLAWQRNEQDCDYDIGHDRGKGRIVTMTYVMTEERIGLWLWHRSWQRKGQDCDYDICQDRGKDSNVTMPYIMTEERTGLWLWHSSWQRKGHDCDYDIIHDRGKNMIVTMTYVKTPLPSSVMIYVIVTVSFFPLSWHMS